MTIGGYMQIRFTYIDAAGATSQGQDDRASFDVRRARLDINGFAFTKDLEYKILYELATTPGLRDAYLDYRIADELHVRAGQMKRPFSRQQWTSDMDLELPDRVSAVERFRSVVGDRDVGLLGWGFIEKQLFEWYLGIYNGDGLNNGTPNIVNLGPNATGLNVANSSNDGLLGARDRGAFCCESLRASGLLRGRPAALRGSQACDRIPGRVRPGAPRQPARHRSGAGESPRGNCHNTASSRRAPTSP